MLKELVFAILESMDQDLTPTEKPAATPIERFFWVELVVWLVALEAAARYNRLGLFIAIGVGLIIAGWSIWQWRRGQLTSVVTVAKVLAVITSIAGLSFVAGPWPQQIVILVSAGLLSLIERQRLRRHDQLRGRTMALATAVLTWFGWFSLLSASVYLNIKLPWLIVGAAVVTAAAAHLVWLEAGIDPRQYRWGIMALAWFGAELFVATWWLPTTVLIGSTAATTILALTIQASRHLWKGHWEPGRSRRYLLVGTTVLLIIFVSARWI